MNRQVWEVVGAVALSLPVILWTLWILWEILTTTQF